MLTRLEKYKHSKPSRKTAEQPAQSSDQPQNAYTPNLNHSQSTTEYRIVENPNGERTTVRKATVEDAMRQNVPVNHHLGYWDPDEKPLIFHGFVFDAMSLGRWIADWTLDVPGADSILIDMAGELWGLLIQLAGKVKLSEDFVFWHSKKRNSLLDAKVVKIVDGFVERGRQLMENLQELLWSYEALTLETRDLTSGQSERVFWVEFVRVFFNRGGGLSIREEFEQDLRMWIADWNQYCRTVVKRFVDEANGVATQ